MTPKKSNLFEKLSSFFYSHILGGGFPERYISIKRKDGNFVNEWPTVNFLITKNLFDKIKGFGRDIWPGEDSYICKKIIKNGYRIVYKANLRVYHFRRTSFFKHLLQITNYGFLRGKLCREDFDLFRDYKYYFPSLWFMFLMLLLVFSFFNHNFNYLAFVLVIYFFLIIIFSEKKYFKKDKSIIFFSLIYFFLSHLVYGYNFIKSFFQNKI